jgi:5-methylcytosine-specific restriction endonuclease McrA
MLSLKSVRDEDLLRELGRLVTQARGVEAEVVAHIGEVELRRLYAQAACSSMFEYCRSILGLRENEAYLRITVARAAREHPVLLEMLRDGRLHLSGIARLAPHLTRLNADAVLRRACGMSHREIRELVAELEPRPDVAPSVRKLPQRPAPGSGGSALPLGAPLLGAPRVESEAVNIESDALKLGSDAAKLESDAVGLGSGAVLGAPRVESEAVNIESDAVRLESEAVKLEPRVAVPARPAVVEPLAPSRYQVRFTASAELREKLERLQALMRSSVPDGDLAQIIEIAVTEKLQRVEAKRFGKTKAPRKDLADTDTTPSSRHIPAAVRRLVYQRAGGRCAYRDRYGRRCSQRHDLEFHHKHPFAHGGDHSPANLTLMCKAHNTFVAEQDYGEDVMARFRAATTRASVPVDAYGARIVVQPRSLSSG